MELFIYNGGSKLKLNCLSSMHQQGPKLPERSLTIHILHAHAAQCEGNGLETTVPVTKMEKKEESLTHN